CWFTGYCFNRNLVKEGLAGIPPQIRIKGDGLAAGHVSPLSFKRQQGRCLMFPNRVFRVLTVVALGLLPLTSRAEGYTYTRLDVPGSVGTNAFGINDSGEIVGLFYTTTGIGFQGFLLEEGSYTTLDPFASTGTGASGINPSGRIVGGYYDAHTK